MLTGMGGVGKTQIAAAYARSRLDAGWMVAWMNAADRAGVATGLTEVAAALGADERSSDLESIAAVVGQRLEAFGQQRLVVFDGATDIESLAQVLPSIGQAQVIITSTKREAGRSGTVVPVRVFDEVEALTFLAQRTGLENAEGARDLGYASLSSRQPPGSGW